MVFLSLSILTPPHGTKQKLKTRCTSGPRPIFLSFSCHLVAQGKISRHSALTIGPRPIFFFYATSWHRAEVLDALLKRSTPPCGPRNKPNTTVRLKRTLTETSRPTPLKGQARKGAKQHKYFLLSSTKTKTAPKYIATLIHKNKQRKENKRVQQQKT